MQAINTESRVPLEGRVCQCTRQCVVVVTREELAVALKISLRLVDKMVADEDVPCMTPGGDLVRFNLPDVVRHLTATAGTRKHARSATFSGNPKEVRNQNSESRRGDL